MSIKIFIFCDGDDCVDYAGESNADYYSGYNPMQGVTMKKRLQQDGWSFRGPIDSDDGAILCPKCFKEKAADVLECGSEVKNDIQS